MRKNPLSLIKKTISSVFGKLNWQSPPWVKYLKNQARIAPKLFFGISSLIFLILIALAYTAYWYKNLPTPTYTTAAITVPAITPNTEEELVPNNLIVDFGVNHSGFLNQSVAPLQLVGKTITKGISMTPSMPGTWIWNTDSQLVFTPSEDWPAGQKFTIKFTSDFFAAHANMERYHYSFSTLPFMAKIAEFKLFQDPVHAEIRNAAATIEFNYPVNSQSLEQYTSLLFQANASNAGEKLPFTYSYDKNKRVAYLHSETVTITDVARFLNLTLNKEVSSSTNSGQLEQLVSKNLLIPDAKDFLKVVDVSASIVRNDKDRPEQILNVETSLGINESEFNKSVHFYLLPTEKPASSNAAAVPNYQWQNPGEVTPAILALATPLDKVAIPSVQNYATLHSFKINAQTPRSIYVKVDEGMKGFGGFSLGTNYATVLAVPAIPKEISFLHQGSLLALSGEKKLSVVVRGVPAVKFDFARVLPENINQLVTQTQGNFNNPYFINPTFNQQNISQISSDIQQVNTEDMAKQHYTALDFSKYLSMQTNTLGPQGLFLLQATGWDVQNNTALDVKASRMILITDLALVVKDNNDGSHDVFIASITQGTPVAAATVTLLGKNGLPILSRTSDDQGRVTFPSVNDFIEDREPTVYVAAFNNDVSFIPFNNANRQLNFSKFDIGGLYTNNQELHSLSAYIFSDRGIYRPGDTVYLGMIVKQAYAMPQPAGLPLQATVMDSRGTTIKDEKITLNDTGYLELNFVTNANAPTGLYTVNLSLIKDGYPQSLLGSQTFKVSEFMPDRMRIKASLNPESVAGWSNPKDLTARVSLWNLYGAPAANRKVSAKILLVPQNVQFKQYAEYVFNDPLNDPKKPVKVFNESLPDLQTNDKGEVEFDLNLSRFEQATYELTFFAEGFEADGGRSVTQHVKTLVSPLAYFVGYKPDGDLSFIKQNDTRSVHYVAVNSELKQQVLTDLKIQLISLQPVTTLVKNAATGTYQYQSIMQPKVLSTSAFPITAQGMTYNLPTQQIGNFVLNVLDKNNVIQSQLKYTVVGASQQPLAKNAELAIKLNKEEYQADEDIEIQITAPYTGSGLITIERDRVYASQWFKTETTNSMQTIHIPADFQGDGYINVTYIRDWNSPEIFISPLSYSVLPFSVNHDHHKIKIDLHTAELARPGQPLTINYSTDKAGKIIVFAVDEGILQVARYETPDPLAFFFQKHALEVLTQQTVDQIMPQFIQNRELSAVGGDGGDEGMASRLNPFKRKTDLPVAFWSGIIDTDNTTHQLTYEVPDYFNGTLKVMAVAVSADSLGSQESETKIRGDFIINPNVPTFVAPGDEFEVSASVANNAAGSGEHAKIQMNLTNSPELEIIGNNTQILEIAEGREQVVHYKIKAKSMLGGASLSFKATLGNKVSMMNATLSVRPPMPLNTVINNGKAQEAHKTLSLIQTFYPQYRQVHATVSTSPMILLFGLQRYLDEYPYGCTEQLTSKVLPLLAMNQHSGFALQTKQIHEKVEATIDMLSQRQMSHGGFSYWPGLGDNQANDFATVYAMHFLTEAKAQQFNVPNDLFLNGLNYLKTLASQPVADLNSARIQAYAIYILTLNEIVTSNYLANLQLYLEKDKSNAWQSDITTVYLAASYQLLKSPAEANRLLGLYKPQNNQTEFTDFHDSAVANAQYLYLVAKHFPNLLSSVSDQLLTQLIQSINNNELNTMLSGFTSLALGAFPQVSLEDKNNALSITKLMSNNQEINVPISDANYQKTEVDSSVQQIRFNNPDKKLFFYQLVQTGFNKDLPNSPLQQGLEVFREYKDAEGHPITDVALGDEIKVHIQIRALGQDYLSNIAIEDLLPGGFEVVAHSIKNNSMDYADVREDRVNFFGGVSSVTQEITYKIKATNKGTYTVPPTYAQAMYDPKIKAHGVASLITVKEK